MKQRPKPVAQHKPVCPPNAAAKGFTLGRGRGMPPAPPAAPGTCLPFLLSSAASMYLVGVVWYARCR